MIEQALMPFQFVFMQNAFFIALIVAVPTALLSCYLVLKGWALMGDAISHAVLPGIVLAYIANIPLVIGAFVAGMVCSLGAGFLQENSRVKQDTVLGIVYSGMFGFGMGQYARFFDPSQSTGGPLPDNAIDKLRTTQIAYGHNGYFLTASTVTQNTDYLTRAQRVKEYYTMQSLSEEWAGQTPTQIHYRAGAPGSPWLTLSEAIKLGTFDFHAPVIRTHWTNGLQVITNRSGSTVTELGYQIPKDGWVATRPSNGYLNLNVIDPTLGTRVQRVVCADYELADGNGVAYAAGGAVGTTTNLTVVNHVHGKSLVEQPNGTIQQQ